MARGAVASNDSLAGVLAAQMARLFAAALAEGLRPLSIAPAQFTVLAELWRENGVTQRDLVGRLDVEQATMANTLNRMERDGLIRRQPHERDRRAQIIRLTEKARSLEEDANAVAAAVNARALSRLSPEERLFFTRLMRDVVSSLRTG